MRLQGMSSANFADPVDRCEYAYRLGRIYDGLGREDEAVGAYISTIRAGIQLKEYYAARAALQAGYITSGAGISPGLSPFLNNVSA